MATNSTNACIFWYPSGSAQRLKIVDLGEGLSTMEVRQVRDEATRSSISGMSSQIVFNARWLVRITAQYLTDEDVIAELEAVCNHLSRGGAIAVAEQGNKTLGSYLRAAPRAGGTAVVLRKQLYGQFGGSWTPQAGERLLLRGPSPRGLFEPLECFGTLTGGAVSLSNTVRHDWDSEPWVYAHNRGFWPGLRLRRGSTNADLLPGPDRLSWTLDLPLEEPPDFLYRLAEAPDQPLLGDATPHQGPALDDLFGPRGGWKGETLPGKNGPVVGKGPGPFWTPRSGGGRWF